VIDGLRIAAQPDRSAPPELAPYLEKVRLHAYEVTDRDIEQLKALGFSEDEIFEHTVSAAVAAGLERLDAGMSVLP
jgi:alkylhydroperoxidase family enzyme